MAKQAQENIELDQRENELTVLQVFLQHVRNKKKLTQPQDFRSFDSG